MKKFSKKLVLNKKTVANLDPENMSSVKGGIYYTNLQRTCNTWCNCATLYWFVCPTVWPVDPNCALPPHPH